MSGIKEILSRVGDLISGARRVTHGPPEMCFETVAEMWSAYLSATSGDDIRVDAAGVARMMVLLKIARAGHAEVPHADHDIDACGYAALAADFFAGPATEEAV